MNKNIVPLRLGRKDLLRKLREVIQESTTSPADDLIALGRALLQIGNALKGYSAEEAKKILQEVIELEG